MNIEQQTKENILDLIMYLFERHAQKKCEIDLKYETLLQELIDAGFNDRDLNKASNWLGGLFSQQDGLEKNPPQKSSVRVFTFEECLKIGKECRNLILRLERVKILNPTTRELTISRLMELGKKQITVAQAKLVILMVLSNQSNKHHALACIENLVLNNYFEITE